MQGGGKSPPGGILERGGRPPQSGGGLPADFFSKTLQKIPPNKKPVFSLLKAFKRLSKGLRGPYGAFRGVKRPSKPILGKFFSEGGDENRVERTFFRKRSQEIPPRSEKSPPQGGIYPLLYHHAFGSY